MALAHQVFSRCIQGQRLLLCSTHINTVAQKRGIFYKKKIIWTENTPKWLFHEYKFTLQELKSFVKKNQLVDIKEEQKYDEVKVAQAGKDLAAAHMFLKLGGKVKFVDDDVWYQKFEHQPSPLPTTYEEGYKVEAVDVSNIVFLHEGLQYFYELEHVKFIRLSKSKYVDDWYIETIIQTCPNLEALDISDCPQITDNGLEILYRLKNLKVVNITNCHKIKCSEAICAQLYDLLPDLNVIGLDSLTNVTGSEDLLEYEINTSRYMSWGSFLNQKLGLDNEINIDEFMVSQMKKLGIEIDSDKDNASAGKQDVTEANKDSHADSDLKHSTVGSVNT